ncbi:cupin domain-containing protein [Alloalcanivorax xenomutans]
MTAPHYLPLPDFTTLPSPVYFRYDEFPAGSESLEHRHDWGQLNYTTQGIMHLGWRESGFCRRLSMPYGFRPARPMAVTTRMP